jgi:hypothetical protein
MNIMKASVATACLTLALVAAAASYSPARAAGDSSTVHKSDSLAAAAVAPPPPATCRAGFFSQGPFLCMSGTRGPNSLANAQVDCRDITGHVSDYFDWRYRIFRGDGVQAPVGFWLGIITADNTGLFVNSNNVADFDGETSRFDSRFYTCAFSTVK